jgi:hypothetical protein
MDGQATIEGGDIVIRFSIAGLVEYVNDAKLDDVDTVSEGLLRNRLRLREIGSLAFARTFVDELNREREDDYSPIDSMFSDALEYLSQLEP